MSYYDQLEEITLLGEQLAGMKDVPVDHPDRLRYEELLCALPSTVVPGQHLLEYHKEIKKRSAKQADETKRDFSSLESDILRSIATEKDGDYITPAHVSGIVQVAFEGYRKKLDEKSSSVS